MLFKNTSGPETCDFQTALLSGGAPNGGLWTVPQQCMPFISRNEIAEMRRQDYFIIAHTILQHFIGDEISSGKLLTLLDNAYYKSVITIDLEQASDDRFVLRLDRGPTLAFKDYAMRALAVKMDYFLDKLGVRRGVIGATSGDTGPAAVKAFHKMASVRCFILYAKNNPTEAQRRQMTTVGGNTFAIQVNDGDFDVCQALMKRLLYDVDFAEEVFGDKEYFTTANSINLVRVLAQIVYHFWAYSRLETKLPMVAAIGCGNYGNLTSATIARRMGLPIECIVAGQNGNNIFYRYLKTGQYEVKAVVEAPSYAMVVADPNNMPRLFDLYGGRMNGAHQVVAQPDHAAMCRDFRSAFLTKSDTYESMAMAYADHGVLLDPHGGVAWGALDLCESGLRGPKVVYDTASPAKFPLEVEAAIGIKPPEPEIFIKEAKKPEIIFEITAAADRVVRGGKETPAANDAQYGQLKEILRQLSKMK